MENKLIEIAQAIKSAGRCALIAHVSPDGDTLGSTLGLSFALDELGIAHDVYCEDAVPHSYSFMAGVEKVHPPSTQIPAYPLAISVDVSDHHRLGECAVIFDGAQDTIVIDHHKTNPLFGKTNLVVDCAATGELMLHVIKALGAPLTKQIAENLYIGISTDTGNFNYANTTGDALHATAELVDAGVDVATITELLYRRRTPAKTMLIGKALSKMELRNQGAIAVMAMTQEDFDSVGASGDDSEGLINYGIECEGVQAAIFAKETDKGTKMSLRSKGRVDVGVLAASYGGGGHCHAAGVTIEKPLEEAVEAVYQVLIKELAND